MGVICNCPGGYPPGTQITYGTPCICCGYYPKDTGTSTFNAFIVFTSRTIKDAATYKTAWTAYAEKAQGGSDGVKAMFSYIDKTDPKKVVQFAWYDTPEDFKSCLKQQEALAGEYAPGGGDWGTVWGRYTPELEKECAATGVTYQWDKAPKGFARADGPGFKLKKSPMIWVSKRKVKPGTAEAYLRGWQRVADMQFFVAEGLIASSEKFHPDPDHVMSLRVFSDFAKGFQAHAVAGFPCIVYMLGVLPSLGLSCCYPADAPLVKIDGPFPLGVAFCSKEDLKKAVALNPGNASYTPYEWEDGLIGPKPDFTKGKTGQKPGAAAGNESMARA